MIKRQPEVRSRSKREKNMQDILIFNLPPPGGTKIWCVRFGSPQGQSSLFIYRGRDSSNKDGQDEVKKNSLPIITETESVGSKKE